MPPTVTTTAGPITGALRDGVAVYQGIPYAAPPVGELRWRPPEPPEPWTEPRACTAYGPSCPQLDDPLVARPSRLDEGCLTLNVWTAAAPGERGPVLVFLHGGAFHSGSSDQPTYDGTALARDGAVVVTVNYRLGVLGFLAHPELTAESPQHSSGNYGLLDQLAALAWVRDHIAGFGGDPGCVTLCGESAGGTSVALLLCSPLARGLFHRAIVQSGGPPARLRRLDRAEGRLDSAETLGVQLEKRLGARDLAELRRRPWPELLRAAKPAPAMPGASTVDLVNVDGWVLTEPPRATLAAGRQAPMPLLAGTCADEGTVFVRKLKVQTLGQYEGFLRLFFGPRADEARAVYPAANDAEVRDAVVRFVTDGFHRSIRTLLRAHAPVQPDTWQYLLARRTPALERVRLGAFHGAELAYLFGVWHPRLGYGPEDEALGRRLRRYWLNFAATGDPNGDADPPWPPYDPVDEPYLILDTEPQTGHHLRRDALAALERLWSAD